MREEKGAREGEKGEEVGSEEMTLPSHFLVLFHSPSTISLPGIWENAFILERVLENLDVE